MKFCKKMLCIMLALVVTVTGFPSMTAEAAAKTELLSSKQGKLYRDESSSFEFSLPVKSKVYVNFKGKDSSWILKTSGCFNLNVYNAKQENVYHTYGEIRYEDRTLSFSLPAGKYKLEFQAVDGIFNYWFSMQSQVVGSYPVKSLKLNKKNLSMTVGEAKTLKATYNPAYTTDKVKWSSSNTRVATVSSKGEIKAKALGTATITCKMGKKKATCKIAVNKLYLELDKGKSSNLTSKVKNIKNYKKAKWTSSKKSVATISNLRVKGRKHGKSVLTVKSSGKTYTVITYVYDMKRLEKEGIASLKRILKNPSSLIINSMKCENNTLLIDYNAMNGFGGYPRGRFRAWYDKGKLKYFAI